MSTNCFLGWVGLLSTAAAAPVVPPLLARVATGQQDWAELAGTWHMSLAIAGAFACVAIAAVAGVAVRWRRDAHPMPLLLLGGAVLLGLVVDLSLWGFASLVAYLTLR